MQQSSARTVSSYYHMYRCMRRPRARRPSRTTPMRCHTAAARAAFHIWQLPTPSLFGRCSSCSMRAAVDELLRCLLAISIAAGAHLTHDLLTTYSRLTHDLRTLYSRLTRDLLTTYSRLTPVHVSQVRGRFTRRPPRNYSLTTQLRRMLRPRGRIRRQARLEATSHRRATRASILPFHYDLYSRILSL